VQDYLGNRSMGEKNNNSYQFLPSRLSDINAAVALVQCNRMKDFLDSRRNIAAYYDEEVSDIDGVTPILRGEGDSFYRYILHVDEPSCKYAEEMRRCGVDARISVNPWLDVEAPMTEMFDLNDGILNYWRGHLLSLPIYPSLKGKPTEQVMSVLKAVRAEVLND